MGEELFYEEAVRDVIRAILVSKGVTEDLEGDVHEVVLRCIRHVRETGRPPETVKEAVPIARSAADKYAKEVVKKRVARSKRNVGPTGDADEHAAQERQGGDPVDASRALSAAAQKLTDKEREVLTDVSGGVRHRVLAAEHNMSEPAMRKWTQRIREKALAGMKERGLPVAMGMAAVFSVGVALYFGAFQQPGDSTHGRPPDDDPREVAYERRSEAAAACKEKRWDACEEALDRAARLDPEGDRAREVSDLRAAIAAGRDAAGPGDAR